jgi:hypothetical protein
MRRYLLIGVMLALPAVAVLAKDDIYTVQAFSGTALANTQTVTSAAIDLNNYRAAGTFAAQLQVSGPGSVKVEYQVAINGTDYVEPTGASDVFSGFCATNGPGADGKGIASFAPVVARYLRLKLTSTGVTTNSVWIAVR